MIGNAEGLPVEMEKELSAKALRHLARPHYEKIGKFYRDFKVSNNTQQHNAGWPSPSEFSDASRDIMLMMDNKNYDGVREKLDSYKSIGVNFIPVNLPK